MSRRRKWLLGAAAVLVIVVAAATIDATRGDLTVAEGRRSTAWSSACYLRPPREDRELLERCAKVVGRVVYVQQEPGRRLDVHVAVIVDFGVVLVKMLDPPPGAVPGVGARFTAVGPLVRSRPGYREIQGFAIGEPARPIVERIPPRAR